MWERDKGRCTFVEEDGRQCREQNQLEFHHQRPFARGGDHSVDNVALLCRAHNGYLAEIDYGHEKMAKYRGSPDRVSEPPPGFRVGSRRFFLLTPAGGINHGAALPLDRRARRGVRERSWREALRTPIAARSSHR